LLDAVWRNQVESRANRICERYQEIREVAASPRQFRSVEEHLVFVKEISKSLKIKEVADGMKKLIICLDTNSN
jgi:hypothetical protein